MSHFPQTHLNAPFHASHPMLPPNPPHYSSTSGSPRSPFIPQLPLLLCCICISFGVHQNSPLGSSAWLAVKHMLFIYIYTSLNQNFCAEEIKKKAAFLSTHLGEIRGRSSCDYLRLALNKEFYNSCPFAFHYTFHFSASWC